MITKRFLSYLFIRIHSEWIDEDFMACPRKHYVSSTEFLDVLYTPFGLYLQAPRLATAEKAIFCPLARNPTNHASTIPKRDSRHVGLDANVQITGGAVLYLT